MSENRVTSPILVTGVPRSGTTWLARLLALAPHTALTGREPMNPRGRQYALAGSLPGWTRLSDPSLRQRRALTTAYRGLNPWVYSRYGLRQWAAPLPRTRVVVKDPFGVLSIATIAHHTRATPVLVYRHPGAVLNSYRRMGWEPDLDELQPVVQEAMRREGLDIPPLPRPGTVSAAAGMGSFWAALHAVALADIATLPDAVVVSHAELAGAGEAGGRRLFERLGLAWSPQAGAELTKGSSGKTTSEDKLHNLARPPAAVASAWRNGVDEHDIEAIEEVTADVLARLEDRRLRVADE